MFVVDTICALIRDPAIFFIFQEFLNSIIADIVQVFNHAHAIFCTVSLVQFFYTLAGETFTLKAKITLSLCAKPAMAFDGATVYFSASIAPGTFIFRP